MGKRKKKKVDFVFKAHPSGEKYKHDKLRDKTKTFMVEDSGGSPVSVPFSRELFEHPGKESRWRNSMERFLFSVLEKGKSVVAGETFYSKADEKALNHLHKKTYALKATAVREPVLENIKSFFNSMFKTYRFRHKLIVKNLEKLIEESKTPIEGQFGSGHSLLSRELKEKGVDSSRRIQSQVFPCYAFVLRKLLTERKPSRLEFKRGFVSFMNISNKSLWKTVTGKKLERVTAKDARFFNLVETTLLNQLSEKQIDKILESRHWDLMFSYNNLPKNPSRKKIVTFLNKHSPHWRKWQSRLQQKKK